MPDDNPIIPLIDRRFPVWIGYPAAVIAPVLLTGMLLLIDPYIPIGGFPIVYVVLVALIFHFFDTIPAILAFIVSFALFDYYFVPPLHQFGPIMTTSRGWAQIAAFLVGTVAMIVADYFVKKSNEHAKRIAILLAEEKGISEYRRNELETTLSSMASGVIVVDKDRRITYINDAAVNMAQERPELGQSFESWIGHENIRESDGNPIRWEDLPSIRALNGETTSEKLMHVKLPTRPEIVVNITASPIRDNQGEVKGAVIMVRDITEQIRLKDELDRQKLMLETFAENLPVGLEFVDPSLRFTYANKAAMRILGISPDRIINKSMSEVFPEGYFSESILAVKKVLSTGRPVRWHDKEISFVGRDRFFDIDRIPVFWSDGSILGVGVVVIETTGQVEARKRLESVYRREHHIAESLQTALLGDVPDRIDGFEFQALYKAALDEAGIGGDFYDVFRISSDSFCIVIGDVSGKGLEAASQLAMVKSTIRCWAYEYVDASEIMRRLNETLAHDFGVETFATVFIGILDCSKKILSYANGGHSPAIWWDSSNKQAHLIPLTGPLVGQFAGVPYLEQKIELGSGDEIMLATDGLYELKCQGGYLGLDKLIDIYSDMKTSGPNSELDLVEKTMGFCKTDLRDDLAVLRIVVD